jgi:hypothetical protein
MSQKTNDVAVRTIGIDTGKNTFHLIGLNKQGTIVLREKLARGRIGRQLANASPCLIGIEAGLATHYVARERSISKNPGCPRMLLLRIHPTRWNQKCCRSTRFLEPSNCDQAKSISWCPRISVTLKITR